MAPYTVDIKMVKSMSQFKFPPNEQFFKREQEFSPFVIHTKVYTARLIIHSPWLDASHWFMQHIYSYILCTEIISCIIHRPLKAYLLRNCVKNLLMKQSIHQRPLCDVSVILLSLLGRKHAFDTRLITGSSRYWRAVRVDSQALDFTS
jgi:hypothetical protein